MNLHVLASIALISPVVFVITAIASWFQAGIRPAAVKKMAVASTVISIIVAAITGVLVIQNGLLETSFIGFENIGFSLRLDALSSIMFMMIALLGFIVVRFSQNYLDGDARQGTFIGRLAATIASVQLLVLAGNLGLLFVVWVLTSISLHRLLVFYRERPGAIIAARKKFIVARLGDAALFAAAVLLYNQFGTGNLEMIFQEIKNSQSLGLPVNGIEGIALLLALAAILKSAQFPTHGWLVEVMETPTPVSALLHAGLLNAGPFLVVRMAFIMEASTFAPAVLIAIGGFTALFASVVFLTQTSVKTALGYSSVGHMGFSLMACGLGVYPAAMLHLVAHSFYKAHAFLSSGSGIETIRAHKITGAKRIGSPFRIVLGIILGLGLFTAFAMIWGINPEKEFALLAIGGIIVLGLSRLFTSAIDSSGSLKLMLRAGVMSLVVTLAFFSLESGFHYVLSRQLPDLLQPTFGEKLLIIGILSTFSAVVFIQILAPRISSKPAYRALVIHIRNGLYVNTLFDRMVNALYTQGSEAKPLVMESQITRTTQKMEQIKRTEKFAV